MIEPSDSLLRDKPQRLALLSHEGQVMPHMAGDPGQEIPNRLGDLLARDLHEDDVPIQGGLGNDRTILAVWLRIASKSVSSSAESRASTDSLRGQLLGRRRRQLGLFPLWAARMRVAVIKSVSTRWQSTSIALHFPSTGRA